MLLYLTGQTWTRGKESDDLAAEVTRAMDLGVHVQLAHEMPGAGGQHGRFGCEFSAFFGHPDGTTPSDLLQRGIYSEIAVPLKGGPWREASMALFGVALGQVATDKLQFKAPTDTLDIADDIAAFGQDAASKAIEGFSEASTGFLNTIRRKSLRLNPIRRKSLDQRSSLSNRARRSTNAHGIKVNVSERPPTDLMVVPPMVKELEIADAVDADADADALSVSAVAFQTQHFAFVLPLKACVDVCFALAAC